MLQPPSSDGHAQLKATAPSTKRKERQSKLKLNHCSAPADHPSAKDVGAMDIDKPFLLVLFLIRCLGPG